MTAALSWASNEEILFEQIAPDAGIHRVNANGGRPELVIPLDTAAGEARQRRPLVLRDAGIVVYGSYTQDWDEPSLVLYRLSDGRRERLGIPGVGALALFDDRLVYSRLDGTVMAIALDPRAMRSVGREVPLTPRVAAVRTAVGLSEGGTLAYRAAGVSPLARLDLVDTAGIVRRVRGEFTVQGTPRFSPDGRRVVVGIGAGGVASRALEFVTSDLWTIDLATGEPTRVTAGNVAAAPSWSPDGKRLIYLSATDRGFDLWAAHVDGSSPPSRLVAPRGVYAAAALVPDGRSVIVQANVSRAIARGAGLLRIWIDGSARVDTLIAPSRGGLRPEDPRVSPDGRWVAFLDRTTSEAWVRSLSGAAMLQVSTIGTGSGAVAWGADSRRLYCTNAEGVVVIELQTTPTLSVVRRRTLRALPPNEGYDLAPDGKTFVVVRPVRASTDIFVAVNWANEARREWGAVKHE